MQGTRMVPLTTVPSEFAARVLVAKLGSAGILAEVRGVSRTYPALVGTPEVWVESTELAEARELITTDADDELEADAAERAALPHWLRPVLVAIAVALLATLALEIHSADQNVVTTSRRAP